MIIVQNFAFAALTLTFVDVAVFIAVVIAAVVVVADIDVVDVISTGHNVVKCVVYVSIRLDSSTALHFNQASGSLMTHLDSLTFMP